MKSSHINPHEALSAFKDLDAKELIPMHFGTFDLTDEPLGEPEEIIKKIAKEENLNILSIGKEYLI
jgi:L-ascorbate metabolism protein UlaG (beta-lactamase superfamily)